MKNQTNDQNFSLPILSITPIRALLLIAALVAVAIGLDMAAAVVASTESGPAWLTILLGKAAWLPWLGVAGVILAAGWALLVRLIAWLAPMLMVEEIEIKPEPKPEPEEIEPMARTIDNLGDILTQLDRDTTESRRLATDAAVYAGELVNLAQGLALKEEDLATEAESLRAALAAIESQDPLKIAIAAGGLRDEHLRTLMFCEAENPAYWRGVVRVVGAQYGSAQQWHAAYLEATGRLLTSIGAAKARIRELHATRELTEIKAPLLQVEDNLLRAGNCLKLPGMATNGHRLLNSPLGARLLSSND